MYLNFEINPPALVQFVSGSYESEQEVRKFETSSTISTPMEMVKQYMIDEINAIRETRHMLKNKYPELFSLYAC